MAALSFGSAASAEMSVDEVIVRGSEEVVETPLLRLDGGPVDLAAALVSSTEASLSTNSRGEVGLSVRGRSEREVRTTLNGFSLFDPWDDRLNLANLPGASFVAEVDTLGAASEGSGSALRLTTLSAPETRVTLEVGDFGHVRGHGLRVDEQGMIAAEGMSRDGVRAPDDASLPFSQGELATRTNTDREHLNLLAAGDRDWRGLNLSGVALMSTAAYGVAPESHLDPESSQVRFWRLPQEDRLFVGTGVSRPAGGIDAEVKTWLHLTRQKVNVFSDETYTDIIENEISSDFAAGVDASLRGEWWGAGVSLHEATHTQQEFGQRSEDFARQSYAVWSQLAHDVSPRLAINGDIRHEGFRTTKSGGREESPDLSVTTSRLRIDYASTETWGLRLEAARLGRLPSQRELYGEALGRFLVNPGLTAEKAWAGEGGIVFRGSHVRFELISFIERRMDAIDQAIVQTPDGPLRQRINTDGYRALGVDVSGQLSVTDALSLHLDATLTDYDVRGDATFLTERPEHQVAASVLYRSSSRVDGQIRLRHQAGAFSLGESGERASLPASTAFDLEAGWVFKSQFRSFIRLENAFDAEIVPQLGLPAPGRALRLGVIWTGKTHEG